MYTIRKNVRLEVQVLISTLKKSLRGYNIVSFFLLVNSFNHHTHTQKYYLLSCLESFFFSEVK